MNVKFIVEVSLALHLYIQIYSSNSVLIMQLSLLRLTTSQDTLTVLKLVLKRNTRHGSGVQLTLSKVHQGRGVTNSGRMPVLKKIRN